MRIVATRVSTLPRLAWLAHIDFANGLVRVLHGDFVETSENHIVEGCWDGPFNQYDFDQSENFFGSGLRCRDKSVVLVPSRSLTDRVLLARSQRTLLASNSLPLILAAMGGELDPKIDYRSICHSILTGIKQYSRSIPTTSSNYSLEQIFYRPERVNANKCISLSDDNPVRFKSFEEYESALLEALTKLNLNCESSARRIPVSSWSTLSTGYDSCATAALAAELGILKTYVTGGERTLNGSKLEDSRPIAEALGLETHILHPKMPAPELERLCLAATYDGRESIFSSMFDDALKSNTVGCLWSGYHGDKMWDRASAGKYLNTDLRRGDTSGFNLTEIRLTAGFFNIAVPFLFARSISDIVQIANSSEMVNWQVGGDYDRPVPRRIAETRGVPRAMFGQKKKAVLEYYKNSRNANLHAEYLAWLHDNGISTFRRSISSLKEEIHYRSRRLPFISELAQRLRLQSDYTNSDNLTYVWAVNSCVQENMNYNSLSEFQD